ncbi:MAG: RNA methyltransferase, partial [Clostridiaceae bacterium]|nr:RNA methyltransferase [Clostridiaceae bacterium]
YNDELLAELKRIIVLENVQDPGNAGTIIRTADAFGFDAVIFSKDSVDPYNSKVIRSTMGSLFHIPVIISKDIYSTLEKMKDYGLTIIAAHPREAELCYEADISQNIAIVIGNEGSGLSEKILNIADKKIMTPMKGSAESLNASVAASILLYESMRQRDI